MIIVRFSKLNVVESHQSLINNRDRFALDDIANIRCVSTFVQTSKGSVR
jgi:hypothetical protein